MLPSAMALGSGLDHHLVIRPLAGETSRRIGLLWGLVWRRTYPRAADLVCLADVVRDTLPPDVRKACTAQV